MIEEKYFDRFIAEAHRVGDAELTICSSGNLSWRIGKEVLVSGTGSWVPNLRRENISVCRLATGEVLNGVKPSMESGFYLGVLRERPDVDVVLHFQSTYATAVACMKEISSDFNVTAEIPCHVGSDIPVVPYFRTVARSIGCCCRDLYVGRDFPAQHLGTLLSGCRVGLYVVDVSYDLRHCVERDGG